MKLYAGIDGGQSLTVAALGDENGKEIARGYAGPADELGEPVQSTRLRDALQQALAQALRAASMRPDTDLTAVVAGVSGYDGRVRGAYPALPSQRVSLLHDAPVAHAGAFRGGPGIIAIVGTGSVVYAQNAEGATLTLGGWGYLFGDEGSAFWLAKRAIAQMMEARDADARDAMEEKIAAHFRVGSLREFARKYYGGDIPRLELASFAPIVTAAAESGDDRLRELIRQGVRRLVELVRSAGDRLQMRDAYVAVLGGVAQSAIVRETIASDMRERCPTFRHVEPKSDAAAGALLLASRVQ